MKRKKYFFPLVLLVLICLVLVGTGTYAAYTNTESVKTVVVNRVHISDFLFSSNYLHKSTSYPLQLITAESGGSVSFRLTICNYLQKDISQFNSEDIPYTLNCSLIDANEVPVTGEALNKITISGSKIESSYGGTLTGGVKSTHQYEITCSDVNAVREYRLRVVAIPNANIDEKLSADFQFSAASNPSTAWTGRFTDDLTTPGKLAAFNYEISGTAEGEVRLSWNPERVSISPWFLNDLGTNLVSANEETGTCRFRVGNPGQPTSYQIQFYRTNGIPSGETNETVQGYVTFPDTSGDAGE